MNLDHYNAVNRLVKKMENAIGWLKMSGMKINTLKTEICIFHRRNMLVMDVELLGLVVKSRNIMNVLGIRFDSRLKWNEHVDMAIKGANASLYGIRMIKKFFTLTLTISHKENIIYLDT